MIFLKPILIRKLMMMVLRVERMNQNDKLDSRKYFYVRGWNARRNAKQCPSDWLACSRLNIIVPITQFLTKKQKKIAHVSIEIEPGPNCF